MSWLRTGTCLHCASLRTIFGPGNVDDLGEALQHAQDDPLTNAPANGNAPETDMQVIGPCSVLQLKDTVVMCAAGTVLWCSQALEADATDVLSN